MILDGESWMNIRRFKVLHDAGATYAEIARECGCDWRTVRRYLAADAPAHPPRGSSSCAIRSASSIVVPGRTPSSTSARLTHVIGGRPHVSV